MSEIAESTQDDTYHIACSEVWGGNSAVDERLDVPGLDAWVHSAPFRDESAGGDIYYVSTCGSGRVSRFAVADVAGHGSGADVQATFLRDEMRRNVHQLNVSRLARAVNRAFSGISHDGHFATALFATYFAPSDHLVVCNAGHPRPLWYRARKGTWKVLDYREPEQAEKLVNLPLGIIEPTDYRQFAVPLELGDMVLLYSDPFIESRSPAGALLGEDGFLSLVQGLELDAPESFGRRVLEAISGYRGGPAEDDETLVVLRHNGKDPHMGTMMKAMAVVAHKLGLVDY